MANPPLAQSMFDKAVGRAAADDGAWFASHPLRKFRLREFGAFEFREAFEAAPVGQSWRVVVAWIDDSLSVRVPVTVSLCASNEGATDIHLVELFNRRVPDHVQVEVSKSARVVGADYPVAQVATGGTPILPAKSN